MYVHDSTEEDTTNVVYLIEAAMPTIHPTLEIFVPAHYYHCYGHVVQGNRHYYPRENKTSVAIPVMN